MPTLDHGTAACTPFIALLAQRKDEPWVGPAVREAASIFSEPKQLSLQTSAILFALIHACAIDYLRQAPVILLGASFGAGLYNCGRRAAFVERVLPTVESGARLHQVMRAFGCAPPLRALKAVALPAGYASWVNVRRLSSTFSPSQLAPLLPTEAAQQSAWLQALMLWSDRMESCRGRPLTLFRWAAWALSVAVRTSGSPHQILKQLETVVDFACASARMFDERYSFAHALEDATRWNDRRA
jgi:hypothetical protein